MTTDELRALAAGRGPWQWHWDDDGTLSVEYQTEGDRCLIALADQLALLCAEMAEAIKGATEWTNREAWDKKEAALASLKALEKP